MHDDLLEAFATSQRRRGLRAATITERERFLRLFFATVDPHEATAGDVEQWLDGRALAIKSRSVYLSTLSVFFAWMSTETLRVDNPVAKIDRPRLPRMLPRPAATFDLAAALEAANVRMRCWLLLAAYQGLRCFEIAGLRREDVLDGQDPPLLRVSDGKGGHQRMLPLNPRVLAALRAYGLPSRGHVFRYKWRKKQGAPLSAHAVSNEFNRFLREHGVSVSAHQYRHSFGSNAYSLSRDLRMVQELMGHADPRSTAGYVAINPDGNAVRIVNALG